MNKSNDFFDAITKPTLVIHRERVQRNITQVVRKTREAGVRFRPHFKTHQSAEVGEWFRAQGVEAITVSSVDMAAYFADFQWEDITIAFPCNIRELPRINELAARVRLNLLVESPETAAALQSGLHYPLQVWIKIDVGTGRTGIPWDQYEQIAALAGQIAGSSRLTLAGLLTHAGHSYRATSPQEVNALYHETVGHLNAVREYLAGRGFAGIEISVGDTPSAALVDSLSGINEFRPGNFVYFDVMQMLHGVCREEEIAVAAACPVVAKHPERGELVIFGGAVHLSKEVIRDAQGEEIFGRVALPHPQEGWSSSLAQTHVARISQEHGIIKSSAEVIAGIQIGDLLMVLPVHSCLTADLLRRETRVFPE